LENAGLFLSGGKVFSGTGQGLTIEAIKRLACLGVGTSLYPAPRQNKPLQMAGMPDGGTVIKTCLTSCIVSILNCKQKKATKYSKSGIRLLRFLNAAQGCPMPHTKLP